MLSPDPPTIARLRQAPSGFTLIETVVALAVFSIAAIAMLHLSGMTTRNIGAVESHLFGSIVARNIAVEAMTDPVAPPLGVTNGKVKNGDRDWRWVRDAALSPEPRLQRIAISVRDDAGRPAANLTIYRPAR